jgi:hypothetical protein
MTRKDFGYALKIHDWYYCYSDDHGVWQRGTAALKKLRGCHKELGCPFSLEDLRKWAHNMIVGRFVEESPGKWYVHPKKYQSVAPASRADLVTDEEWNNIENWMEKEDEQSITVV